MIRRITIDYATNVYEVTNLYDQFGNDTEEPTLAKSCVIMLAKDRWVSEETINVPIYTVH